jgi:hypothetical protein
MQNLFTVVFEDNSVFVGGSDYKETKWKDIPDKKIRSIFYRIPTGDYLCLSGYEKYYHMVEVTMDLMGENKGKTILNLVKVFAKKGNNIRIYTINLISNEDIKIENTDTGNELVKQLNPVYWK